MKAVETYSRRKDGTTQLHACIARQRYNTKENSSITAHTNELENLCRLTMIENLQNVWHRNIFEEPVYNLQEPVEHLQIPMYNLSKLIQ